MKEKKLAREKMAAKTPDLGISNFPLFVSVLLPSI
jgi:hypothetical protein